LLYCEKIGQKKKERGKKKIQNPHTDYIKCKGRKRRKLRRAAGIAHASCFKKGKIKVKKKGGLEVNPPLESPAATNFCRKSVIKPLGGWMTNQPPQAARKKGGKGETVY